MANKQGDEPDFLAPYHYVTKQPGKGVRTMLIDAFNFWFQIPEEQAELVKEIAEKLHNGSLLVDDIEDNSKLRRGVPVAHSIYGVATTINCANYMYFDALKDVLALNQPGATEVYTEEMLKLHHGQGLDIYWRDNSTCPTEEQYKEMVMNKTGGLFRLILRLMQLCSTDKRDYSQLVNDFAVYFQILDDLMNLQSATYHKNKSFCEDLTEGKYSFPIIHSIRQSVPDRQLQSILKQCTDDFELKKYALKLMQETNSLEYTSQVVVEYHDTISSQIQQFGGNENLTVILEKLHTGLQSCREA